MPVPHAGVRPIRLGNWNAALVPAAVFMIGVLGMIAGAYCWIAQAPPSRAELYGVARFAVFPCLVVCAVAVTSFARQVLWIEFGEQIVVRWPSHQRRYNTADIHAWRLRHHGRDDDRPTSDVPRVFVVLFEDGLRFEVRVRPSEAARIQEELMKRAPIAATNRLTTPSQRTSRISRRR